MFRLIIAPKNAHNDLIFICETNNFELAADSYHLILSQEEKYQKEIGYRKVFLVLKDIFSSWIDKINQKKIFLPYDFWDEYIGGLLLEYTGEDDIILYYGFVENYELSGENIEVLLSVEFDTPRIDDRFQPITIKKIALIEAIKHDLLGTIEMFLT